MDREQSLRTPLTTAEVTKRYHLSRTTLWKMRTRGELKSVRIGRKVLFLPEHLDELLRRHER